MRPAPTLLLGLVVATLLGASHSQAWGQGRGWHQGEADVHWLPPDEAFRLGGLHHKPILVYVHTSWCGWCRLLEQRSLKHAQVRPYLNARYYATKLDAEATDSLTFRQSLYTKTPGRRYHSLPYLFLGGEMVFPTMLICNPRGEVLTPLRGYVGPRRLRQILAHYAELDYLLRPLPPLPPLTRADTAYSAVPPDSLAGADSLSATPDTASSSSTRVSVGASDAPR